MLAPLLIVLPVNALLDLTWSKFFIFLTAMIIVIIGTYPLTLKLFNDKEP
ncbi:hypothetical protein J2Z81_001868 [Virgibacillus campisalis]|uniref:Permease n=1 Tax=Virgibacillus alimentarius TaxID=698769 RepID=A0ABS4S8S6_9BACI|nr:hypothetical protein [Virgibacillus alimentarius]